MATSSIKKNFVISSKKSALEVAKHLLEVENTDTPTLKRPRVSHLVIADQISSYFASMDKDAAGR